MQLSTNELLARNNTKRLHEIYKICNLYSICTDRFHTIRIEKRNRQVSTGTSSLGID